MRINQLFMVLLLAGAMAALPARAQGYGNLHQQGALETVTADTIGIRGHDGSIYEALLPAQGQLGSQALLAKYKVGDQVEFEAAFIKPRYLAADHGTFELELRQLKLRKHGSGGALRDALKSPAWRAPDNRLSLPKGTSAAMAAAPAPADDAFLAAAREAILAYVADLPKFVVSEQATRTTQITGNASYSNSSDTVGGGAPSNPNAIGQGAGLSGGGGVPGAAPGPNQLGGAPTASAENASRPANPNGITDDIHSLLAVVNGQEARKDVTYNGNPWNHPFGQLPGLHWSADYAGQLSRIFRPACGAVLKSKGQKRLDNTTVAVYEYQLAPSRCAGYIQSGPAWAYPGYKGKVYISTTSHLVVRLEQQTTELPSKFGVSANQQAIDWSPASVGGASWMMPKDVELTSRIEEAGYGGDIRKITVSVMYSGYRPFGSSSSDGAVPAAR